MRVLLIDHGGPDTTSLVGALEGLEAACDVCPADGLELAEILRRKPRRILLAPGLRAPEDCRIARQIVQELAGQVPILGIGLGMHVIASVSGARLVPAKKRRRKDLSLLLRHDGKGLFEALPSPLALGRDDAPLALEGGDDPPPFLEYSAWSMDGGAILGLRLSGLGVEGLQVLPPSFLTPVGADLLFNFLYRSQT
ncbi:MAG TPA: hypothetical protein DD490_26635, partial [Acidobacteria bacterium]|nr:hypothetical protein [Acidobacteriota bacterium]